VTWPNRTELTSATIVVITTTLLLALFVGVIDSILSVIIRVVIQ